MESITLSELEKGTLRHQENGFHLEFVMIRAIDKRLICLIGIREQRQTDVDEESLAD